jgi:hypothetical protein
MSLNVRSRSAMSSTILDVLLKGPEINTAVAICALLQVTLSIIPIDLVSAMFAVQCHLVLSPSAAY